MQQNNQQEVPVAIQNFLTGITQRLQALEGRQTHFEEGQANILAQVQLIAVGQQQLTQSCRAAIRAINRLTGSTSPLTPIPTAAGLPPAAWPQDVTSIDLLGTTDLVTITALLQAYELNIDGTQEEQRERLLNFLMG